MALKTTATTALRVIDADLSVTYARRKVYGSWTHVTTTVASTTYNSAWEYTRTATKTYRYVGLTYAAAAALKAVLDTYYRRSTKISEWDSWNGIFEVVDAGLVPMADVVCQHDEGDAYSVVVSVHEEDHRTTLTSLDNFSTIFATENQRTYDTGDVPS